MKCYQIKLKEWGLAVKYWGKVYAPSASKAINQVCIDGKPYQEWIASREDFSTSAHCQLRLSNDN